MKLFKFFFLTFFFYTCTNHVKNNETVTDEVVLNQDTFSKLETQKDSNLTNNPENYLLGNYIGWFEPNLDEKDGDKDVYYNDHSWNRKNKINISIDKIVKNKIIGHSVVAGNKRPFEGEMIETNYKFVFNVKEPGDNKFDGTFEFEIRKNDTFLYGKWTALNNKIDINKRKYNLTKVKFIYNPNINISEHGREYVDLNKTKKIKEKYKIDNDIYEDIYEAYSTSTQSIYEINASNKLLTKKEVENLKKGDLLIIRNAIYARHGYSFKSRPLRIFFDAQDWYIPISTDIKDELTEIEKKNIELLLKYEKNATEYYDYFGRR